MGNIISVISTDARFINKLYWVGIRHLIIRDPDINYEKTIDLKK